MNSGQLIGAVTALGLFLGTPLIKTYFPTQPYLPGLLAGISFSLFWFYSSLKSPVLFKNEFKSFKLVEKLQISPNTAIYTFALPNKTDVLGLPIGQHISIGQVINEKEIVRSYTPVSSDDDKGVFKLLIKTYPTGNISKMVDELNIGDSIKVKGPKGNFVYSNGLCDHIGMIAGGTGITPMLQIIKAVLKNKKDKTKLDLIFANVNQDDILCKQELDELAKDDRFNVFYVLNNPPKGWNQGVGFVTREMVEANLKPYSEKSKVLLCGPPPMVSAMSKIVQEFGYPKANTISKLPDAIFKF